MTAKREATSPVQADHLVETASKNQDHHTPSSETTNPQVYSITGYGDTACDQRRRLLNHLQQHGSISTVEARQNLDMYHPAARVQELRERGEPIQTVRVNVVSEVGTVHRVARYILSRQSDGLEVQP